MHDQGLYPDDNSFRFTSISYEEYETFRKHRNNTLASQGDDITTPVPKNLRPPSQTNMQFTPAETFKKSIKRDSKLFISFKDGKFWDNWRRNTLATARAQDVAEVLDPKYVPGTNDDIALFQEK